MSKETKVKTDLPPLYFKLTKDYAKTTNQTVASIIREAVKDKMDRIYKTPNTRIRD